MGRDVVKALLGVLGAVLLGVLANDIWALSSAMAQRLVTRAARLWARDLEQAQVLSEEWRAYINDRPGQLLKLLTASGLLAVAVGRLVGRKLAVRPRRQGANLTFRVPRLDARAAEAKAVLVGLIVGLISSLAPLLCYAAGFNTKWSYLGWGIGLAVAVGTAASSLTLGFLVRPRPLAAPVPPATMPAPDKIDPQPRTEIDVLVRPFVLNCRRPEHIEPTTSALVRPYVGDSVTPPRSPDTNS
jgi:hypothetical protein